jgi:outer membrane receptor protein involved in Fe transport
MTKNILIAAGLLALAASSRSNGQTSVPSATPEREALVRLDPFEVQADSDKSYGALNSNSITQFSARLDALPISADIFTDTMMKDLGNPSVEQLIQTYSAGAGLGSAVSDPGSGAASTQPGDRSPGMELRGMGGSTIQRDGIMGFSGNTQSGVGLTSNFDLDRVEIINGPQSLLYATGGAGGVINLISKRARLGQKAFGSLLFQVDQYGNKLGMFDYGAGTDKAAVRIALVNQDLGTGRRVNIGGPASGYYAQIAVRLFNNTTIRVNSEESTFSRFLPDNLTLTAASTSNDARNGQFLNYLIASNQINAAANGGASGAGPIDNGIINWDNVGSYGGSMFSEKTLGELSEFVAETQWTPWLSTQIGLAYRYTYNDYVNNTLTYYAPNNPANPLGVWAIGNVVAIPYLDTDQSSRSYAYRATALLTNSLFHDRAHSQTIVGFDGDKSQSGSVAYSYFQADSNFNVIVNPSVTTNNGRTTLPKLYWPITSGPVQYPLFNPARPRLTYQGVNYVRMISNEVNPAAISPLDPNGVTAGGANYSRNNSYDHGLYMVNYTQWLNNRLDTLVGVRYLDAFRNVTNTNPALVVKARDISYDVGADYHVTDWLHPYFSVSDSYNFPGTIAQDVIGENPPVSEAIGEEIGVKSASSDGKISGSLAVFHVNSKNEQYLITATLLTDINPSGLNGRYGSVPAQWIFVDRASTGAQATLTANPVPNWRLRFSAGYVAGIINTDTSFGQLYNDQFYQNAAGQVTYADGAVVYVNPTFNSKTPVATSATPGAIPLTVGAMSTSGNVYFSNPLAVTGQINSASNVATVLRTVDPQHGAILTGKTGLPISQIQINPGFAPSGTFITSRAGDVTTGYPGLSFNLTSVYTVPAGAFKGFDFGGTVLTGWKRNFYYYYTAPAGPGVPRNLFRQPTLFRVDPIVGYSRKFRRITWSSQLNITNVFNHYKILILPSPTAGYGGVNNATFDQQPRIYQWTNTLSF